MLSRLSSHFSSPLNATRLLSNQLSRFSTNKVPDQIFINGSSFVKKDDLLIVYASKEGGFFKKFSLLLGGLLGYNIYGIFSTDEEEERTNSVVLAGIFGVTFLFMRWKISRTLRNVYLDPNGRTVYLDFFRFCGFGSKVIETETLNMGGYNYFLHKSTQIPICKYRDAGKKRFAFLKWSQATNLEILKNIFQKRTFIVGEHQVAAHISNSYKKKYM